MKIRVNGKDMDFEKTTIQDLVNHFKLKPGSIVIEKNSEIVDRDRYNEEELNEGDVIEIIRFVGGG